ncbi:MAG: hypothetical protein RIM33_01550 [Alphaproteobacteria bacterium]
MGVFGLILICLGLILSGTIIGWIPGIPLILLGVLLCILAVVKGGISALFRLGSSKGD